MNWMRAVGWLLIFGSVIVFSAYCYWAETRDLRPLVTGMSLAQGHKIYTFKTNVDYGYTINLTFKKSAPFEEMACALGVNLDDYRIPPQCGGQKAAFDLSWVLTGNGKHIADFSSADDYLGDKQDSNTFVRSLGHFDGKSGRAYMLDVYVPHDERFLSSENPVLSVEVGTLYSEGLGVGFLIWAIFCLLGFVVGIVLLVLTHRRGGALA